jgi:hypothetical protein
MQICQINKVNTPTYNVNPDREAQYLLIEWMRWNEKLNAMPPSKAVDAVKAWADLVRGSLEVKVWNN